MNSIARTYMKLKTFFYWHFLSDNHNVSGHPVLNGCAVCLGRGTIEFGNNVHLGFYPSPFLFNTYIHLEARESNCLIKIGNETFFNNNATIIAASSPSNKISKILIGSDCMIGMNFLCLNSDFHALQVRDRNNPARVNTADIQIGNHCFIGANVTVLKGVNIGDGSVIGAGSVVTRSIPANALAVGNPARVIKQIQQGDSL